MKKVLFFTAIFAIIVTMSACDNGTTGTEQSSNPFIGTWRTEYSDGSVYFLTFGADTYIKQSADMKTTYKGKYSFNDSGHIYYFGNEHQFVDPPVSGDYQDDKDDVILAHYIFSHNYTVLKIFNATSPRSYIFDGTYTRQQPED